MQFTAGKGDQPVQIELKDAARRRLAEYDIPEGFGFRIDVELTGG